MPYATLTDVQSRMPQFTLTATTAPNLETAQVFLDDVHAHFESAALNLGYSLPIIGARALGQVKEIVCNGAIARILLARGTAIGTDAAFQSADRHQDLYDMALKHLGDPNHPMELVGATRTGDEVAKPGIEPMGLVEDEDGNDIEPRFTMSTRW